MAAKAYGVSAYRTGDGGPTVKAMAVSGENVSCFGGISARRICRR